MFNNSCQETTELAGWDKYLRWLLSANSGENLLLFVYHLFGLMVIIDKKFMTYLTFL